MALVLKDRVREQASTTGTGTFTLSGSAYDGYRTFASCVPDGSVVYYCIHNTATGFENEWEVGYGTYTLSGNTLSRTSIMASSNSGSAVNFSAGTKEVFITYPAEMAVYEGIDNKVANAAYGTINVDSLSATAAALTSGTVSATPSAGTDIANKTYVDTVATTAIDYHLPVRGEVPDTTGNLTVTYNNGASGVGATLTNAGTQAAFAYGGVSWNLNDRVLVYNQTSALQNGVYTITDLGSSTTNWVLTRATDADSYGVNDPNALDQGSAFFVQEGDGAGETYACNTPGVITFGTTAITFTQISAAQIYSAGTGLTLSGTQFSITNTGTAGTYGTANSVPVLTTNAQGQVTSATNTAIAIAAGAVSGLAASATTDTTNAANISSGTLPSGRLSGSYTGITGVGTLTAGTWTASTVGVGYGGTGLTSYTTGDIVYASASGTLASLADVATGNALISGGVGVAPSYGKIGLTTHITGTLAVANGGTGATALTGYVYGNGTGAMTASTSIPNSATTATSANTASAIVARDASGNFSAGTITAALSGNASTATSATTATNATNVTLTTSATASAFKVPFANTTVSTTGNYGLLQDSAAEFTYNPSTNTLTVGTVSGALSGNATTSSSCSGNAATATALQTARTINGTSFNGTADITVTATATNTLTLGSYLTGGSYNGSAAITAAVDATSANTASKVVARDASGNFSAGTITATLSGNATTATTLATARTIALSGAVTGTATSFNGSANITIPTTVSTTQGGIVYGASTTAYGTTAAGTAGQMLLSNGTSAPSWVTPSMTLIPDAIYKASVSAATTANITLSGTQTIDGVAVVAGMRVLVKNQTTASQNGIYVASAGAWTRATDADASAELGAAVVGVDAGTANGGELWTTNFKTTDTLGTTAMNWYEVVYNSGTWAINTTGSAATLTTPRTINGVSFNGSANITVTANTTNTLTLGSYLTGGSFNGSAAITAAVDATSANTASKVVARDASGNFSAGTITATLSGNATSATTATNATNVTLTTSATASAFKVPFANTTVSTTGDYDLLQDSLAEFTYNPSTNTLAVGTVSGALSGNATTATTLQTARTINGTSFNGSANITTANWGTARTLSFTGDVTGSSSVNGSANVATAMTLANSGVTANTYGSASAVPVLTVDAKGRITSATTAAVSGGQYFGTAAVKAIAYNSATIAENITITAGNNGLSAGPVTVSTGYAVTINTGGYWVIV